MSKETKALENIKKYYPFKTGELEYQNIDIIKTALNDNHFYKHMISKICAFMRLDINPFENLVTTENEILNHIVTSECYVLDKNTVKKLKTLEIIEEKGLSLLHKSLIISSKNYEEYRQEFQLVKSREFKNEYFYSRREYESLKEVLL